MAIGWLDLDLRHLQTFRILAEERSFRATARRLGFAQSGISRHIATLEQRVGATLVVRGQTSRGVELTPAGQILLEHAEAILGLVAVAERDFSHRGRPSVNGIRIGTFQSVSASILADAIARVKRDDPRLAIDLVDTTAPVELVRAGEVDLAFSETAPSDPRVEYIELFRDPYLLVSGSGENPKHEQRVVSLEELASLPLMTFEHSCHLDEVEKELASDGVFLRPILRSDDALTLQSLAAGGAGVALLPKLAVGIADDVHIDCVDPRLRPRSICLLWNVSPPPSKRVASFIETIRRSAIVIGDNGARQAPRGRRVRAA